MHFFKPPVILVILLSSLLLRCLPTVLAQPSWRWANSAGTAQGYDRTERVVVTPNGQIITLASQIYSMSVPGVFRPTTLSLTATDSTGTLLWTRNLGTRGPVECEIKNLVCDAAGSIYVLIDFGGTLDLGSSGTYVSSSSADINARDGLLLKLNGSGNILWGRQLVGNSNQVLASIRTYALIANTNGEVWVGGEFFRELTCGPFILTLPSGLGTSNNGFLARYSAQGQEQDLIAVEASYISSVTELQADRRGFVYVVGYVQGGQGMLGSLSIPIPATPATIRDFFVAKLTPQMQPLWVRSSGNRHYTHPADLALTSDGGYVVAGYMMDTARFGSTTFITPPANIRDIFIVRYDSLGQVQWVQAGTGQKPKSVKGLSVDAGNNVYATGAFYTPLTIGGVVLPTTPDSTNGYVVRYNRAGNADWVSLIDGVRHNFPLDMTLGAGRTLYVAGGYNGTMTLGSTTLTSTGFADAFLARLDGAGPLRIPGEADETTFALYPNPVTRGASATIELGRAARLEGRVQIIDALGRQIYEIPIGIGDRRLDLHVHNLASGLYWIRVWEESVLISRKLMIR